MCVYIPQYGYRIQRTALCNTFSPSSSMWVLAIKLSFASLFEGMCPYLLSSLVSPHLGLTKVSPQFILNSVLLTILVVKPSYYHSGIDIINCGIVLLIEQKSQMECGFVGSV